MTTQEEILSSLLPTVLIDKISLYSKGEDNLLVTLNLITKEILDNDLIGTWFGNKNIDKYLKFNIIQCVDDKLTEGLSISTDMVEVLNKNKKIPNTDPRYRALSLTTGINNFNALKQFIEKNTKVMYMNFSKNSSNKENKVNDFSWYDNEDGKRVYEINYDISFEIKSKDPLKHLSYFVVSVFDIEAFSKDFNISYDVLNNFEETGNVISEIVINDFKVSGVSYVYETLDGKSWTGPAHQDSTGTWKTGYEETPNSKQLNKIEIINTKIQDFRDAKEIEKLVFDFSEIENTLFSSNLTKIQFYTPQLPKNLNSYFTDFMISRTDDGYVKFAFGIDFYALMKDNSYYSKYFSSFSERFKKEAISKTKIRNIKILRRRIKNNFKLSNNSSKVVYEKFNENDIDDIIIHSKDRGWKNFQNIQNFREIDFESSSEYPNIRYFTGVDKKISELSSAVYQYGIELEVEDGTLNFLRDNLMFLNKAKNKLKLYYEEATTPSIKKYYKNKKSNINNLNLFENYDQSLNRFTRQYISKLNSKYSGKNRINSPWVDGAITFVNTLDIFSQSINSREKKIELNRILMKYLKPETANTSSILKVIELYDLLITSINKVIGNSRDSDSITSVLNITNRNSPNNSKNKNFIVQRYFDNHFDTNFNKIIGIDYLSTNTVSYKNLDGLTKININNLVNRANIETLKFFKTQNPKLNIKDYSISDNVTNSLYTYYTPTRIDFYNKSYILNNSLSKKQSYRILDNLFDNTKTEKEKSLEIQNLLLNFKLKHFQENNKKHVSLSDRFINRNQKQKKIIDKEIQSLKNIKGSITEVAGISIEPFEIELELAAGTNTNFAFTRKNISDKLFKRTNIAENIENINHFKKDNLIDDDTDNDGIKNFLLSLSLPLSFHHESDFIKQVIKPKKNVNTSFRFLHNPITNISYNITNYGKQNSPENQIKPLPNQLKALMAKSEDIREEKLNSFKNNSFEENLYNSSINYLDFNMITEMQYLDGFENNTVNKEVKANRPIWKKLNFQDIQNFSSGKELICRLKSYENSNLNIQTNMEVQNNLYDKYFIITTDRKIKQSDIIPSSGLITRIIDNIKMNIPNLNLKPAKVDLDKGSDILKANLVDVLSYAKNIVSNDKITLNPLINPVNVVNNDINSFMDMKIENKKTMDSTQIAVDVLTMDNMSTGVHTSTMMSNQVPSVKLKKAVINAANRNIRENIKGMKI